jgi:cation diffusion facilitator family transporter
MTEKAEKRRVTLISLAAALVLILLKLSLGLATGYLILISEALHSSLDALVTVVTFLSIRYAERPADQGHPYGHGKAENLAAFTESLLLFFAIALILKEVVERLFFKSVAIEPNIWAVSVLVVSALFDAQRSKALARIAEKYKSPAIEADAIHFRADFVTSSIALSGVVATYLAMKLRITGVYALIDVITTCLILAIVVKMVLRILTESADVLLDRTLASRTALIRDLAVEVPEVIDVEKVRSREAGKQTFVDLTVDIDRNLSAEAAYSIGKRVEETIRRHIDDVDVTLQVKPVPTETEDMAERIRSVGAREGWNLHHITVHNVGGTLHVDLDLEMVCDMKLADCHAIADALERRIREDNPAISEINTHIDWRRSSPVEGVRIDHDRSMREAVEAVLKGTEKVLRCTRISIEEEVPGERFLLVQCTMHPEESAEAVRAVSEDLEKRLKEAIRGLKRVMIHVEPEPPPPA